MESSDDETYELTFTFPSRSKLLEIQSAFMSLLSDNNEIIQVKTKWTLKAYLYDI
jgi:hypothetical protein